MLAATSVFVALATSVNARLGLVVPNTFESHPLVCPPPETTFWECAQPGLFVSTNTVTIKHHKFYEGYIGCENASVVVVTTGLATLNTVLTTQLLLDYYDDIDFIIQWGIAGGIDPQLNIGDINIPQKWVVYNLWNWQRGGSGPNDPLPFEIPFGDYTREVGYFNLDNANDDTCQAVNEDVRRRLSGSSGEKCSKQGKECNFCREDSGCVSCRPFYSRVMNKDGYYVCERNDKPKQEEIDYAMGGCVTDNCRFEPNPHCADKKFWGCKMCKEDYFRKNNDFLCAPCSLIPHCRHCNKDSKEWGGCDICEPGYKLTWDFYFGYRRCLPENTDMVGEADSESVGDCFGNVWFTPQEVFRGEPEQREQILYFEADSDALEVVDNIKDYLQNQLRDCVANETLCLSHEPRIVTHKTTNSSERSVGISADIFVDNARLRSILFDQFEAGSVDMETAAVGLVAYTNHIPFIAFRSVSDLAGGSEQENEGTIFAGLVVDNALTIVKGFIENRYCGVTYE